MVRRLLIAVAMCACCLAAGEARAQSASPSAVQGQMEATGTTEVDVAPVPQTDQDSNGDDAPAVFEQINDARPADPAPEDASRLNANGVDPRFAVETLTNAVLSANGAVWDPTLGGLTTGDPVIDRYIIEAGQRHGVDPKLVHAVMNQESRFKKNAVSPKGASGYMQLMPGTAKRFGVTDIFDPKQNIDAGTRYLRFLLDLFNNNVELALAAYNAGEYRVIREGYRVPQIRETQNYVASITSRYYGKTKRKYLVTYGKSSMDDRERDEIRVQAQSTYDDRGTEVFSNNF